jgi:hypothetical protein
MHFVRRTEHLRFGDKTNRLILYREVISVCSENHTKYINPLCGQKVKKKKNKPRGKYSKHQVLKGCVNSAETRSPLCLPFVIFCSVLLPLLFLDKTFPKEADESVQNSTIIAHWRSDDDTQVLKTCN